MIVVATFYVNERIVSMVEFQSVIYVATDRRVFKMVGDELIELRFLRDDDSPSPQH